MRFPGSGHVAEVGNVGTRTSARVVLLILGGPAVSLVLPALAVDLAAAGSTSQLTRIAAAIARFLLYYSGVFALIGLSAAVAAGLLATDRTVMSPDGRILAQAVHRAMSLIGVCALANHIMLEILAGRAAAANAVVPFTASRGTLFMGLGTLASDLVIVIVLTGVLRRRFARRSGRWLWRSLHLTAYAAWPMAILHGLLAGRAARPYVDWSYGICLAAVGLALTVRSITAIRARAGRGQPVPRGRAARSCGPPPALRRSGFGASGPPAPEFAAPEFAAPEFAAPEFAAPGLTAAEFAGPVPDWPPSLRPAPRWPDPGHHASQDRR